MIQYFLFLFVPIFRSVLINASNLTLFFLLFQHDIDLFFKSHMGFWGFGVLG